MSPPSHAPAVCFAIFPSIAQLLLITLDKINPILTSSALEPHRVATTMNIPPPFVENFGVFIVLAHGFILTGMLWGAALAFLIDREIRRAAAVLAICGTLSIFGIIHSVLPTGGIYLPGSPALHGVQGPWHWAAAYFAVAAMFIVLGRNVTSETLDARPLREETSSAVAIRP